MTEPRTDVLVIGYGNPLRGDDGLGQHVVELIAAQRWPGVRTLSVQQLTPELAAELANVPRVVFVDASVEEGELIALEPATNSGTMTHAADPRSLLTLTLALYGTSPRAWLMTVKGCNFGLGEQLSAEALRNAQKAAERITEVLR